jgi:excisionase family DNA binding protein
LFMAAPSDITLPPSTATKSDRVQSPWLTTQQAAQYLGVALGTIRNWTSSRYLPHARRNRLVRYNKLQLDQWLSHGACKGRQTIADGGDRRKRTANAGRLLDGAGAGAAVPCSRGEKIHL